MEKIKKQPQNPVLHEWKIKNEKLKIKVNIL